MKLKLPRWGFLVPACLLLSGCDYDAPLTSAPTHKTDPRLLGDWAFADSGDTKEPGDMHVRQWDETSYAVSIEKDVYRVWHSDFADTAFISVQDLNTDARKYCYFTWTLSADGRQLALRRVSSEVVPGATKSTAAIQQAIRANLDDPRLLAKPTEFIRR